MRNAIQAMFMDVSPATECRDILTGVDIYGRPVVASWRLHRLGVTAAFGKGWSSDLCTTCKSDDPKLSHFLYKTVDAWYVHRQNSSAAGIMAVKGPGAAFDNDSSRKWDEVPPEVVITIESLRDDIPWTQDADIDVRESWKRESGVEKACAFDSKASFLIAFRDGEVWELKCTIPKGVLEPFLLCDVAPRHSRDAELGAYVVRRFERR